MTKLLLGVLLWSVVHLLPGALPGVKKSMVARLGENGYKGVFTLAMVVAIYLVISGWKAAVPESVYLPPAWGRHLTALLVLVLTGPAAVAGPDNTVDDGADYAAVFVERGGELLEHRITAGDRRWGVGVDLGEAGEDPADERVRRPGYRSGR